MAEIVTLTAPVTRTSGTTIDVERITIDRPTLSIVVQYQFKDAGSVVIQNGTQVYNSTTTPTGQSLLNQLNTANFSGANPSFIKKVIQRLQTDVPALAGTISGTPD